MTYTDILKWVFITGYGIKILAPIKVFVNLFNQNFYIHVYMGQAISSETKQVIDC